jgi:hypothetical protein
MLVGLKKQGVWSGRWHLMRRHIVAYYVRLPCWELLLPAATWTVSVQPPQAAIPIYTCKSKSTAMQQLGYCPACSVD